MLSNIFDGLEWIASSFLTNKFKPGDERTGTFGNIPVLIKAYENNDFVLVGDILDYEIKPVLRSGQLKYNKTLLH